MNPKQNNPEEPRVAAIFLSYYTAHSERTRKRQRKELGTLSAFACSQSVVLGDLLADSAGWAKLTYSVLRAYLEHLKAQDYQDSSIALQGYTFKRYAALAAEAGVISPSTYAEIVAVPLPAMKSKDSASLSLTDKQVQQLMTQPILSHRGLGRRDSLCMALLLLEGLWPQSIVSLDRSSIHLAEGTMTFYNYSARQWETRRLASQTLALATQYLALPSPYTALFIGIQTPASPFMRWSTRSLNDRVQHLGAQIGVPGLLPRDCHAYWRKMYAATAGDLLVASWAGNPPGEDEDTLHTHVQQWVEQLQEIYQEAESLAATSAGLREGLAYKAFLSHLSQAISTCAIVGK